MEILAPAGDFKCLEAAISAGADAVYVGGSKFSARKSAANFDNYELLKAVDFCHLNGAKIYVAVNILVKDSELKDALSFLEYIREIGADAVIVQDLGLMAAAKSSLSDLKINASTQLTVHSTDGVKKAEELGAKRVVLARETSLEEIKKIKKETKAELEVFAHGALCMSYSGQCLMSSIIGARSGNRGACAQPCRLPYTLLENGVEKSDTLPLLSPKDLCLIKRLNELKDAGVTSLKIEGRMKSPEYVGMVTRAYKNALKYGYNEEETQKMLAAFSRGGSCEGFFFGKTFDKMMDYKSGAKVTKAQLSDFTPQGLEERKNLLKFSFFAAPNEKISLLAECMGYTVLKKGECAETALKVSLDEERASAQLKKLGGTAFYADEIVCDIAENTAVSVKAINELRRSCVVALEEKICASFKKEHKKAHVEINDFKKHEGGGLSCEVLTAEQALVAKRLGIEKIYVPIGEKEKLNTCDDFIFVLPAVLKDGEHIDLNGIKKICVQNVGQLSVKASEIFAGHRLNIFNKASVKLLEDMKVSGMVLSPELNMSEMAELAAHCTITPEVIAYGRLPLMISENCFVKSAYKCSCKDKQISLKDRKGEIFPVICENCRSIVLNSKVIFMADKVQKIKKAGADLRLMFTIESEKETEEIILKYKEALSGKMIEAPIDGFTRGHFTRGVL